MADPTTPVTPDAATDITNSGDAAQKAAQGINNMSTAVISSRDSFFGMGSAMGNVSNIFSQLGSSMRGFGVSLNEVKSLTTQQREQMTLVTAAVVGARQSFEGLNGINHDGLNTFTNQLKELRITLGTEGPATSAVADGLTKIAKSAGASDSAIIGAAKRGVNGLFDLAQSMLTAADNGLKLQNTIIQMSARTGNLGEVFQLAGPHLENMNALMDKHQQMINDATKATGVSIASVEKYYSALGQVPGALNSLVKSTGTSNYQVNMLTAVMKVATGTGREYGDVIDDLKVAFKNYGLVGEDAIKFSAQMSEVANKLGVEMDTVKKALQGTSDTFKMFAGTQKEAARMSSEFADIMNKYAGSLERTGLSGTQAVDVVKNMTGQLANLSIAQKSFLSAQTGGPGGLMGSFQIDKMMREGRVGEVFEKVRQQMTKQFGSIATREEAETSQSGAARRTSQMMMLRQGPLGQFARSDVEAQRILDGFKGMETGGPGAGDKLSKDIVQDSMDKGTAIQEKSYTVLTEINAGIAAIRGNMNIGALGVVQKAGTAGTGTGSQTTKSSIAEHLSNTMSNAANMNDDRSKDSLSYSSKNKNLTDTSGRSAVAAISGLMSTMSPETMGNAFKQPLEVFKNAFSNGDKNIDKKAQEAKEALEKDIARKKIDMAKLAIDKRGSAMSDIKKEEDALSKINAARSIFKPPGAKNDVDLSRANALRASGTQVGAAANRATATKNNIPTATTSGSAGVQDQANSNKNEITVHVTGFCLKCKQEIEGGAQAKAVNKASQNI